MKAGTKIEERGTGRPGVVLSDDGKTVTAQFAGADGWPFPERRTVARKDVQLTRVQQVQSEEDFEPALF